MKPYTFQHGRNVYEFDPKSGTRLIQTLPLVKDGKEWYLDTNGCYHYGLARDLKPEPTHK
jgi:hypothetical protein